jgi:hypothetical protein
VNAHSPVLVTETDILQALPVMTYDEIRAASGWSRGKIYSLALKHGARKTEARIRERAAERKARQLESLAAMVDTTAKADVLDYLDSLPEGCSALICSSIPYNLGKRYGDGPSADQMAFIYFMGWTMQVISECARVLKDGGTLFLQVGSTRDETGGLAPLDTLLFEPLKKTGLTFQSRVVWTQPHGLTPKGRLSERHETALVFSKGPNPVFNPTPARTPQKGPGKRAFKGERKGQLSSHPLAPGRPTYGPISGTSATIIRNVPDTQRNSRWSSPVGQSSFTRCLAISSSTHSQDRVRRTSLAAKQAGAFPGATSSMRTFEQNASQLWSRTSSRTFQASLMKHLPSGKPKPAASMRRPKPIFSTFSHKPGPTNETPYQAQRACSHSYAEIG